MMSSIPVTPNSFAGQSHIGCVRRCNEDAVLCQEGVFVIADGLGGHRRGDVASVIAVTEVAEAINNGFSLVNAIVAAHQKIYQKQQKQPQLQGMACTIVAALCNGDEYEIAWSGDCRAYLWDNTLQKLTQLTQDHSMVNRLVKLGLLDVEQAQFHPKRHLVTHCLGSDREIIPTIDCYHGQWRKDQQLLLCSDGLSNELNNALLEQILKQSGNVQHKVRLLLDAALRNGGFDNITATLIDSPLGLHSTVLNKFERLIYGVQSKAKRLLASL